MERGSGCLFCFPCARTPQKPFLPSKLSHHAKSMSQGVRWLPCFSPRWLLYPKPFFEDTPYILEPGEYPTLEAWGTSGPTVGSLKPMRLVRSMGHPQGPLSLVPCGVALHL